MRLLQRVGKGNVSISSIASSMIEILVLPTDTANTPAGTFPEKHCRRGDVIRS